MQRSFQVILSFLFLFGLEIGKVYFIMPFPGSQQNNTIDIAYFLHNNIWWIRLLVIALLMYKLFPVFAKGKTWKKAVNIIILILYALVFYFFNFRFLADKMFYQPKQKLFVTAAKNRVDTNQLVLGITINNQSRAYPIEIIGYHHQVRDTAGNEPVMVTYCTVCRTGRVYSPVVNGKASDFRLVGMDHFNAMFEDATTKSWWRQANGEAITGSCKGMKLEVLPSRQMRLGAWLREFPQSLIMQPDSNFIKQYGDLKGFDNGTIKSGLEKRDTGSWKMKSWVVGVSYGKAARAYDWNDLVKMKIINDTIDGHAIVLFLENDNQSFHVYKSQYLYSRFDFGTDSTGNLMKDMLSKSLWTPGGICIEGMYKNQKLEPVQAYQEFWHSWSVFHPQTTIYTSSHKFTGE